MNAYEKGYIAFSTETPNVIYFNDFADKQYIIETDVNISSKIQA